MKLFDLHADTLTKCFKTSEGLYENQRQVSLKRTGDFEAYAQVFAIFVSDEEKDPFAYFSNACDYAVKQFSQNEERIRFCKSSDDIQKAVDSGKAVAILSVENGCALNGSLLNLVRMAQMGVRLLTLCWNGANDLGYGAMTADKPLSSFGRQVVSNCEKLGIIVDVSHLSERGFYNVAEISSAPFVASHSNAKAICDHPRNLTDRQAEILRDRGGMIGINLHQPFLNSKPATLDDIYRHISHFLSLGCEDILAFGSDFDGAEPAPEWDRIDKMEAVCEYLYQRGLQDELLYKLMYENALDFFLKNL